MFTEIIENNKKFEAGRRYFYHFSCNYDSLDWIQVVSISDTRKTAMVQELIGGQPHGKPMRKKIYVYNGIEHISAGNYSMAGIWSADEFDNSERREALGIDFMIEHERAEDLEALPEMPAKADESVIYTADVTFFDKEEKGVKTLSGVSLVEMSGYLAENADGIKAALGGFWYVDYVIYENGTRICDGWTRGNAPEDILQSIFRLAKFDIYTKIQGDIVSATSKKKGINAMCNNCADFGKTCKGSTNQSWTGCAMKTTDNSEAAERSKIEMTSTDNDPDPDNDPNGGKSPENTAYSDFDNAFKSFDIISVTFGGARNSSAGQKPENNKKKLTEKEWKKQLAMKADFEAAEREKALKETEQKITVDTEFSDGTIVTEIDECEDYDGSIYYEVSTSDNNIYYLDDLAEMIVDGKKAFAEHFAEIPDPDQISFDDISENVNISLKNSNGSVYVCEECPINDDLARRAHESYSFSDYVSGSAAEAWRKAVQEVQELADSVKLSASSEFYGDIDRLTQKYALRLADWTNKHNRIQASCPSWAITGPANYPIRKHKKQMNALDSSFKEYEKIENIKDRIKNYANRPIMCGDASALDRLTAKVAELTNLQEHMKQSNADCRRQGIEAEYPAWALSNNLKNLRAAEERLKNLTAAKEQPTAEADELANDFCTVVRNTEIMRLQLIFDGKPDEDTRAILKRNGFRWAPSQSAWQRQLTPNAESAAKKVISELS